MPRSAPAGAPVARLAGDAARWASEYKVLVSSRITGPDKAGQTSLTQWGSFGRSLP